MRESYFLLSFVLDSSWVTMPWLYHLVSRPMH